MNNAPTQTASIAGPDDTSITVTGQSYPGLYSQQWEVLSATDEAGQDVDLTSEQERDAEEALAVAWDNDCRSSRSDAPGVARADYEYDRAKDFACEVAS